MSSWQNQFGKDYTDRNALSIEELDALYEHRYGFSRTSMNEKFIGDSPRDTKILEAGCNIGNQLLLLGKMGFTELHGIDIQHYAVEVAREKRLDVIQASILDIPFEDNSFDLVFTSGVLIHIQPEDINKAISELARVSRHYIWCFEYYAPQYTEVVYRGERGLLWKTDWRRLFSEKFKDLRIIKEKLYKYKDNENLDVMFLMESNHR